MEIFWICLGVAFVIVAFAILVFAIGKALELVL